MRSFSGFSASDALAVSVAYIFRPEECMCCGHLHAEPDGSFKRIQKRDDDPSYLATVRNHWKAIVESETGLDSRDWKGKGRPRPDATSAYGYVIPLPNDSLDDPKETRNRIEYLLSSMYANDSMDITYALHRGEAHNAEHDQNLHLHIFVRPRTPSGSKWRMNKRELWQWNKTKRVQLGQVLQSWGYEVDYSTPEGQGQKRRSRDDYAVFLRKDESNGVVSERVKTFGTALRLKNEGSRSSRWHASCALRYSAYLCAMNGGSWEASLREQEWELCRGSGDRQTWQIKDTQTGKAYALRRLFSCRETEVEQYLREIRSSIEQAQVELAKIRIEIPGAFEHARRNSPSFGQAFGSGIGKAVQREPMGALMLLLLLPGLGVLLAAFLIALKGLDDARQFDEKTLKTALSASWKEEKSLRVELKEKLVTLTQAQKSRPVSSPTIQPTNPTLPPTIRSPQPPISPASARPGVRSERPRAFGVGQAPLSQAIRSGDLKTAGALDKNRDGIADSQHPVDTDGNGVSYAVEHKEGVRTFHVKQNDIHESNLVL